MPHPRILTIARSAFKMAGLPLPFRLYKALGGAGHEGFWKARGGEPVQFEDAAGVHFVADLSDWLERQHYFCGYPEVANLLLLEHCLAAGDTFIDIGANRGVLSLHAARIVGPSGRVISFEPNPTTYAALQRNLALNPELRVETHPIALADRPGTMTLTSASGHHGHFSLRPGEPAHHQVEVRVERGDAILSHAMQSERCLVKIDTEGFELQVLAGLRHLLERPNTSFLVEVTDEWLRRSGGSAEELFGQFTELGYIPQQPIHSRRGGRYQLTLKPLTAPPTIHQFDCYFSRLQG